MNKSSVPLPAAMAGCSSPAHPAPTLSLATWGILFRERQIILPRGSWARAQGRLHGCTRKAAELGLASSVVKRLVSPQNVLDVPDSVGSVVGTGSMPAGTALVGTERWQEGLGCQLAAGQPGTGPALRKWAPVSRPSPRPGLTPGVPLRSPAAEAVAALPGAVDEALSVFALLLDGGVQNGLVQEIDLKHTRWGGQSGEEQTTATSLPYCKTTSKTAGKVACVINTGDGGGRG